MKFLLPILALLAALFSPSVSRAADSTDDPMQVVPEAPWQIESYVSAPTSATTVYSILNSGDDDLNWSVSSTVDWLDFPGIGNSGDMINVTVATNSKISEQPVGVHEAELIFKNAGTGIEQIREVVLTVLPDPGEVEVIDSIAPTDDHRIPFGDVSLGVVSTATVRIHNADPENPLRVDTIQLRPTETNGNVKLATSPTTSSATTASTPPPPPQPTPNWSRPHEPTTILVRFKDRSTTTARASARQNLGGKVVSRSRRLPLEVIEVPATSNPKALLAAYQNDPSVAYAEPNYKISIRRVPNDPRFPEQWSLNNTGQQGGLPGADISAIEAATLTQGSREIIVAVIDTGIDYTHPDLAANMWINPNPTFEDIHGATWTRGDGTVTNGDPMDDNDHGTHCAGIIGAVGNNGIGIAGVNWNVRLMALKFLDEHGDGYVADAVAALEYAIDHGAHITNNSWGGTESSQALSEMIAAAADANQLFVAAAGNDDSDNDLLPSYPAAFPADNIISVASSNRYDERSSLSNYGVDTVDLAAPGEDILSTVIGGGYDVFSGTSMATPHVTGVAALLLSLNPEAHYTEIKEQILASATPLPEWEGFVKTGGRLNAAAALGGVVEEFELRNLPELPLTLAPGRTVLVEVAYRPVAAGLHEATLLIDTEDLESPRIEIELSGTGRIDPLVVVEPENFPAEGVVSGEIDPQQKTYTLRNNGATPLSWSASAAIPWITFSPASGTIAPDAEMTVVVSINGQAQTLPEGIHATPLRFTNTASNFSVERLVSLTLQPPPGELAVTDSIGPTDDWLLPFGSTLPGAEQTESITLANLDDTRELILEDVRLIGSFREDFDGQALTGWDQDPAPTWSLDEGRYVTANPEVTGFMQSTYTGELWLDGTFETLITRQGSDASASALILRASPDFNLERDQGSAIVVGISWNGSYYILRYINGISTWIQNWTASPALLTASQAANRIVASIHGDQLHLFINDQLVWSGKAEGLLLPGRAGVGGFSKTLDPTTHRFHYLEVGPALTDEALPLTLTQSWNNANPSAHADPAFLETPIVVEPLPAGKTGAQELVMFSKIAARRETFSLGGELEFPLMLAPGATLPVPVHFTPSGEGVFSQTVQILSNDPDLSSVEVSLSGNSEKDVLHVSPTGSLTFVGSTGGPFTPSEMTYTLHNSGESSISWEVLRAPAWIEIVETTGVLPANASAAVTVSLDESALVLDPQLLADEIQILNTTTNFVRSIPVLLDIRPTLGEAVDAPGLVWTSASGAPWMGQDEVVFSEGASAQSGRISNRESTWMQTVVQGPGEGSFWWMVSSEEGFDELEFRINGKEQATISGEVGWTRVTFTVPAGEHTLRWGYSKDLFVEEGADAGWLDKVEWTPVEPTVLLVADDTLSFGVVPVDQTVVRSLLIKNEGNSPLTISDLAFPEGFSADWRTASIPPGGEEELWIVFTPLETGDYTNTLTLTSNAGTHTVQLEGFATAGDPVEVENGEMVFGLGAYKGTAHAFFIEIPPGRDWLEISLSGGTGDADLYVRHGQPASVAEWDYAPQVVGNNETVRIEHPDGGTWYFLVHAYTGFSGVTLSARVAPIDLQDWAEQIGLSEEERDLDHRHPPLGITTLEAYAFGRDPREFGPEDLPRVERSPGDPGHVHLIYRVRTDASDLAVTIQTSKDLIEWQAASPASETVLSESVGVEVRRATFDIEEVRSLFIRANIRYTGQ